LKFFFVFFFKNYYLQDKPKETDIGAEFRKARLATQVFNQNLSYTHKVENQTPFVFFLYRRNNC